METINAKPMLLLPRFFWAIGCTLLLIVAVVVCADRLRVSRYIDIHSGDVKTERSLGSYCYHQSIEQTDFSRQMRKYLGPTAPPRWIYCDSRAGYLVSVAIEDGFPDVSPGYCHEITAAMDLADLPDSERKAVMSRCGEYLARGKRSAMNDEANRILDQADRQLQNKKP